jgi:hypothetical protein
MGGDYFVLPSYPDLLRMLRAQGQVSVEITVEKGKAIGARVSRHTLSSPTTDHLPWEEALTSSVESFLSGFRHWTFAEGTSAVVEVEVRLRLVGDPELTHQPTHSYRVRTGEGGIPDLIIVEVPPLPVIPTE